MSKLRNIQNEAGFTLIEVLISLLILAGTTIVLYQSWNGSMLAIRKARLYNTVSLLLQKKAVEFEVKNKDKAIEEIPEDEDGDFGSDFPEFKWNVKTKAFAVPPITPPNAGNQQNELVTTIIKAMTDYFEKAVREVLITVTYKRGSKSQSFALSTVFVDYTKELPLGF